jgi:hypothetical protein
MGVIYGFYFSSDVNGQGLDQVVSVDRRPNGNAILGVHNKHSLRNCLYESEMSADDLETFGRLCVMFARQMKAGKGKA